MKKLIVLLMVISLVMAVQAKSLREAWLSMPNSLLPTFNKNLRLEFVELKDMGVKPEVKNLLGEDCLMDTLKVDFLQLSTSKMGTFQMRLLPANEGDSIICVVKTFSAPEKESDIRFYDQEWKELKKRKFLPENVWQMETYFQAKPDTMSEEMYEELHRMLEPIMVYVCLSPDDDSLTFNLSLPLLSKEEKQQLMAIIVQRKFKWNGKMFNEF